MTKNNDDAEDQVVNVSGADWPGSQMVDRPRTITPPRPGQHVSRRTTTMINAETGQALGDLTERAAADSASHLAFRREHVDRAHPSARPMLEHIFGLNLPERDRA
jgi:hypothetical protein